MAEAPAAARHFRRIVVMDVRLPDGTGIEACRDIRAEMPETRVVMLTSYPDEEAVLAAILAGASGYLLKQIRGRDLVAALEAVGRGDSLLDPRSPSASSNACGEWRPVTPGGQLAELTLAGTQDPHAGRGGGGRTARSRPRCSCRTRR